MWECYLLPPKWLPLLELPPDERVLDDLLPPPTEREADELLLLPNERVPDELLLGVNVFLGVVAEGDVVLLRLPPNER